MRILFPMLTEKEPTFRFVYISSLENADIYMFENQSRGSQYSLKVMGEGVLSCSCPHHQFRGATCKHMLALKKMLAPETPSGSEKRCCGLTISQIMSLWK